MKFDFDNAFGVLFLTIAVIAGVFLFSTLIVGLFVAFGWYAAIILSVIIIAFVAGGLRFV